VALSQSSNGNLSLSLDRKNTTQRANICFNIKDNKTWLQLQLPNRLHNAQKLAGLEPYNWWCLLKHLLGVQLALWQLIHKTYETLEEKQSTSFHSPEITKVFTRFWVKTVEFLKLVNFYKMKLRGQTIPVTTIQHCKSNDGLTQNQHIPLERDRSNTNTYRESCLHQASRMPIVLLPQCDLPLHIRHLVEYWMLIDWLTEQG